MEGAGVGAALERGIQLLQAESDIPPISIPTWFMDLDFARSHFDADVWCVGSLVHRLKSAEALLRHRAAEEYGSRWKVNCHDPTMAALPAWAATEEDAQMRMVLALGRLALGSAVEAAFALEDYRARSSNRTSPVLYNDALLVAVWTSAHAEYVSYVQSGVEEPPFPGVHSFPNSLSEYDFSALFSMRTCPRMCPKSALPLLQVFQRSLNTGSRGWSSILESALQESVATRHVIVNAVMIALLGMHSMLTPSERAPWWMRMRCHRTLQHVLADGSIKSKLIQAATSTKEAVRRMVATFLSSSPALVEGICVTAPNIFAMRCPPVHKPSVGMESLSKTLADAGLEIVETINSDPNAYTTVLNREFKSDSDTAAWIGKTVCNANKTPCVSVLSDIWSSCFRVNFLAFWAHSTAHQQRASRLDPVQHRAIHDLNSVTKLTNGLSMQQQMHAQRLALGHVSAGILTMNEVAHLLGIQAPATQIKNATDALKFLSNIHPEEAAKMFVFARAAWVAEEVVVTELGKKTAEMQTRAIFRRLRRNDYHLGISTNLLPVQATHLHACIECRRVSSSHFSEPGKPGQTFTELGTSSSMLCTECEGAEKGKTHILCSKRSSAALRTALITEEAMVKQEIEYEEINYDVVEQILIEGRIGSAGSTEDPGGGLAARVRRDSKTAIEQRDRAYACGEQRMLQIPLIGRTVRVFGDWYGICSLCGCMLRVLPMHRYGAEICCCKCDAQMLGLPHPSVVDKKNPVCRFCNAVDTERKSSRWKMVKAPLDVRGENATLPPSLRHVFYCPKHYRPWITTAHRVLQTRIILSHIAHNAKPIHSTAVQRTAEELGFEEMSTKKKRKTGGKGGRGGKGGKGDNQE